MCKEFKKDINSTIGLSCIDDGNCHSIYQNDILREINTCCGVIGCIFLILTLVVYIIVPELNNMHGKIVLNNIIANILQTCYLIAVFNFTHAMSDDVCKVVGYLGYFFTILMFCWTSILSVDLCLTLYRGRYTIMKRIKYYLRNDTVRSPKRMSPEEGRKTLSYTAGGWGCGGLFLVGLIILDMKIFHIIKLPNVGASSCFLDQDSMGLYLHLPILGFMIINCICLLVILRIILR